MNPALLHVVTAIANPVGWRSRVALFRRFAAHMRDSGVQLTVAECAYGERPFECADIEGVHHIGLRSRTVVWNKESLLNIAISRLPPDWKHVAWLDADIEFRRPDWAARTVQALQLYDVVQPWADCYDLGPNDEHLATHQSFCKLYCEGRPIVQGPNARPGGYAFAHPGYGWAATRAALEHLGGLIDTAALGAADHHMAMALVGRVDESIHGAMTQGYKAPLHRWQARAMRHLGGNIGYVPGTIEHLWHGAKDKRRYVDRWDILARHRFSPDEDLKRNVFGLIELTGNKPALRRELDGYMRQRDEDSNSL